MGELSPTLLQERSPDFARKMPWFCKKVPWFSKKESRLFGLEHQNALSFPKVHRSAPIPRNLPCPKKSWVAHLVSLWKIRVLAMQFSWKCMWKGFLLKLQTVGHNSLRNEFLHKYILRILLNFNDLFWYLTNVYIAEQLALLNKTLFKGTLMQISKSLHMFEFT